MGIAASGHSQEGSERDSPERRYACGKPSNTPPPQTHPAPYDRRCDHRAKRFSHFDMSKGYHQLELKESLRNVTTFSTHIGLYRYKRLNYGTRSAAEIFQETIREEPTQDPKWVFNIIDDIISMAGTQRNMTQTWRRS